MSEADAAGDEFPSLASFNPSPSNPPDSDPEDDPMDRMLLNLATTTPPDPPDWANYSNLDPLPSDIYPTPSTSYPPLSYIDQDPPPLPEPDIVRAALDTPETSPPVSSQTNIVVQNLVPGPLPVLKKKPHPKSPNKQRVPTAICKLCGKEISANGANFKRHETACRRQRPQQHPLPQTPSQPPQPPPSQQQRQSSSPPPTSQPQKTTPQPPQPQQVHQQPVPSIPLPPLSSTPSQQQQQPTQQQLSRRDADLLYVVRRLDSSISTLDVSARLCLRDALLSLSEKASNPHVPPTPEQETLNRAAEYLVLRMLFLSGQQVMHTAPGTAEAPYPHDLPMPNRESVAVEPEGDGTVAASTATSNVAKDEDVAPLKVDDILPHAS